nr:hypothetical protein CFP56_53375 [Quercus suber]
MVEVSENVARMRRGELYYAFTPELIEARRRCATACSKYNNEAGNVSRRKRVELWRECDSHCYQRRVGVDES